MQGFKCDNCSKWFEGCDNVPLSGYMAATPALPVVDRISIDVVVWGQASSKPLNFCSDCKKLVLHKFLKGA